MVRYNASGTIDTSFGAGGIVTTEFLPADCGVRGGRRPHDGGRRWLAFDQDPGRGEFQGVRRRPKFVLARYRLDGSLDPTFGSGGKVLTG